MGDRNHNHSHVWSIILAGGDGQRLQPFVHRWLGRPQAKQYCAFVGARSMLQHTLDRADRLTASHRKITVIARSHQGEAWSHFEGRQAGIVLVQPANRDTAAGIFLPLSYVRALDRDATVVIYPSDHFVYPEDRFAEAVRQAVAVAEALKDRVILLGAQPDRLEDDYGWILPDRELSWGNGARVRAVSKFIEKPGVKEFREILTARGLWNTLVIAAKAETLWMLGWRTVPEVVRLFSRLDGFIGANEESEVLESIYEDMPVRNFSSHLLQCSPSHLAVVELGDVLWSDWGRAERIRDSLRQIGKVPAFPAQLLKGKDSSDPGISGPAGADEARQLLVAAEAGAGRAATPDA